MTKRELHWLLQKSSLQKGMEDLYDYILNINDNLKEIANVMRFGKEKLKGAYTKLSRLKIPVLNTTFIN